MSAHSTGKIFMRRFTAALAMTVAATLGLAGCAGSTNASLGTPSATSSCASAEPGAQSDAVKVSGEFGAVPTASFDSSLKATALQRTIVSKGTGAVPEVGQAVNVNLTLIAASKNQRLASQQYELNVKDSTLNTNIRAGIDCLPIGTRVVEVFPATDLYDKGSLTAGGLSETETLVAIFDLVELVKEPTPAAWIQNVPTVTDSSPTPTVTIPNTAAPAELSLKVLKPGTGQTITAADTVNVNYLGISWNTKKMFDESYSKKPADLQLTGVVKGFRAALVGQKVGARVLVAIPPLLAYGTKAKGSTAELADQTLVFLIDVIKIQP